MIVNADAAAGAAFEVNEALYAALEAAGLPPSAIVRAADLIVDHANGVAMAEVGGAFEQDGDRSALRALLQEHPPDRLPVTRRVFSERREEEFSFDLGFGLEIIIARLGQLADAARSGDRSG